MRVLLIDPEESFVEPLRRLEVRGETIDLKWYVSPTDARIHDEVFDFVLFEIQSEQGTTEFPPLQRFLGRRQNCQLIVFSNDSDYASAIRCLSMGAMAYVNKFDTADAIDRVASILETGTSSGLLGLSREMRELRKRIPRLAMVDSSVLLTGETGTGKGVSARTIHLLSRRRKHPFVEVNCGAIPKDLFESELFGHVKGAFTGADQNRIGKFEEANGGTLFLDEIADTSIEHQVKLLKMIEDSRITAVGDNISRNFDVRIIAATNKDLQTLVKRGEFRKDLMYRITLHQPLPPLRDHIDDIKEMLPPLIAAVNRKRKKAEWFTRIDQQSMTNLLNYSWPGNIRELLNLLENAIVFSNHPELRFVVPNSSFNPLSTLLLAQLPRASAWEAAIAVSDHQTASMVFLRLLIEATGNASAVKRRLNIRRQNRTTELVERCVLEIIRGLCETNGNIEILADQWGVSFRQLYETINKNHRVASKLEDLQEDYQNAEILTEVNNFRHEGFEKTVFRIADISQQ